MATLDGPHFATVSFCSSRTITSESLGTFRVPVGPTTTVKQLAKGALQRLFSSSRNAEKMPEQLTVTGVYVGGGSQPEAEVFSHDLVAEVVLLREEVVYMRLSAGEKQRKVRSIHQGNRAGEQQDKRSPIADASALRATDECRTPPTVNRLEHAPAPTNCLTEMHPNELPSPKRKVYPPPERPTEKECLEKRQSGMEEKAKRQRPGGALPSADPQQAKTPAAADQESQQPTTRLGWGPDAYKFFAKDFVNSPDRYARQLRKQRAEAKKQQDLSVTVSDEDCSPWKLCKTEPSQTKGTTRCTETRTATLKSQVGWL